jgi:ABC-type nickel/cobalt efflux system permease component RcnA
VDSLPPAAGAVRVAALALADAVLSELDSLLADRQSGLASQRRLSTIAAALALVLALLLLWFVRTRIRPARGAAQHAAQGPPHHDGRHPDDVVDAREVQVSEVLVQVGHGSGHGGGGHAG